MNNKCQDPCPGTCGQNTNCQVVNHNPICSCSESYTGDPFTICYPQPSKSPRETSSPSSRCSIQLQSNFNCKLIKIHKINKPSLTSDVCSVTETPPTPTNPCLPSPCGPNAECQVRGDSPACSCVENYVGLPPNCRPECTINPECPPQLACMQQKCRDPCVGLCGLNAQCSVVNHHAVCACLAGYTGNPFSACERVPEGE